MWKGTDDPGGGSDNTPPSSQELQEMKDQFEQQQMLITQFKEIMKKTDQTSTTVTQEKVAEYANTLTKMKSRAKRLNLAKEKDCEGEVTKLNTPANEKVLLLRQQLEQNKVKLAERGKNQKGIEEMVAQVKAQLDDSQQQINLSQTPLNISLFDERVDYTPQLSSQELYNILLNKDKLINEMNAKISKLQGNVLDLQENVKEKESVIDARTKAITLMSENLSKKGKSTLDALEDTKVQMRRMQENFIEIEEHLKAENSTLKADLNNKSIEIQRLQVENRELQENESRLQVKINELEKVKTSPTVSPSRRSPSKNRKSKRGKFPSKPDTSKADDESNALITALEKQLNNKEAEIEILKKQHQDQVLKLTEELNTQRESAVKVAKVETIVHETDDAELNRLKQQLDEANKNMIKVKAQHKSKLKEMNKKIEEFKKIGDVNAELVKMENENSKLQLKIVDLEEEKDNCNFPESTNIGVMEATIKDLTTKLADQETTINNSVAENKKYQEELQAMRDKLEQMTNDEVKQELSTVQFEEQYESLEKEKKLLQTTIETLEHKIVEMNTQLEALKTEKSEIQLKYDGLLQENAELIDRLEKLSTEKVSSAESIEIVENLTQQEKLELEAYQKSLLPKTSMDNLDDNVDGDLNDSVNQLTEETSELLQKIELFTVERREVMEKLELLTEENNQLSLKLREVENNRDVLVETYEQLQTEKEILDNKLEEYEELISEFKKQNSSDVVDHSAVEEYKKFVQVQKDEINDLQLKLLSYEKTDSVRDDNVNKELEDNYMRLIAENEQLTAQFAEIKETSQNYIEIIEDNKQELIKYAEVLDVNTKLNAEHEKLKMQLEEHQQNKTEQIKVLGESLDEYEKELNEKCKLIKTLENQIYSLQEEKVLIETNLAEKSNEVESVRLEKKQKEIENEKLLNQAITTESEVKIQELQTKNKEQLEKMKKIAANLKKKTIDFKELEAKYNELLSIKEGMELQQSADCDKQNKISSLEAELGSLSSELQRLKQEFAAKNTEYLNIIEQERNLHQENQQIMTRNEEITTQLHTYSAQIEDLQNIIREYESQISSLNREMESLRSSKISDEKNDMILQLNDEIEALKYNSQTSNNALQMKIHEQEVSIETYEQELQMYKEKASRLEEGLSEVEARRLSLEQRSIDLGTKLEIKESSFMEATEKGEHLENRLKALAEKDQRIEEKLIEVQEENAVLQSENQKMIAEVDSYKKQVEQYNYRIKHYEENQEAANALEAEKQSMELKCKNLDNELKKLHMDFTTLQNEFEKAENESQQQLQRSAAERKQMMEELEIQREEISVLLETKNDIQRTVEDLNSKLDQQQTEFEDTINKYHDLQQEHKKALGQLEEYEASIRFQKDVQKDIESPDDVQQLLNRKLQELEEFKRNYVPSPADFFNENPIESSLNKEIQDLKEKLKQFNNTEAKSLELEQEMHEKETHLQINEELLKRLQEELELKDQRIKQDEAEIIDYKTQLDFARNMLEQVEANNFQTLNRNNELEKLIHSVEQQKNDLQQQLNNERQSQQQHQVQWPESSASEPFAFIQEKSNQEPTMVKHDVVPVQALNETRNTQEELLQKIKTLEFIVYNTEQEKENAQIQCAQLSEELGRLIYEREQQMIATSNVNNSDRSNSQFNLESQIVSGGEVSIPPSIPFQPSKDPEQCFSSQNISEDLCEQQRAYECNPSAFADDDGWGFDVEETKVEEAQVQSTPPSDLQEKIRLLNLERDAHLEEIHQANVKSGKLIKKLKEFKVRNEQLIAKIKAKDKDDFGLEDTIQDELKAQIIGLEKKLKEADAELVKERNERENIAKRVDVLTAANERMVELKEKQDIEVMGYQQQVRDLQIKLEKVAWSSDFGEQVVSTSSNTSVASLATDNTTSENKLEELQVSVRELTLDNEELQAMLEEQTRLRKEAEARAKIVPNEVDAEQLRIALDEQAKLIIQIDAHKAECSKISDERDSIQEELRKLGVTLQGNYKEKTLLEASLLENGILIESLKKTIDELQINMSDVEQLKTELDCLQTEKATWNKIQEDKMKEQQDILAENALLQTTLNDLRSQLQGMQSTNQESAGLIQEIANLKVELEEVAKLKQQLIDQGSEYEQKLVAASEQLALEWAQHVDQRGNDVAESWKLHVDQRENEFTQLEQSLRKELHEMEEKCNALVNENNELRRNVDAEIRNEVDRISTLQQHVAKLAETLQQKDADFERLQEENGNLIKQLHDYEGRINTDSEELSTLLQQHGDKDRASGNIEKLRDELKAKDNEITQCKCNIEELTKAKSQIEDNQLLQSEISKEKERNEKLKAKVEESLLQVTTLQGTLQEKEHRLQELEAYLQQLQNDDASSKIQLQTNVQELQQQIAQYVMQLQENNLHIGSLNEEIESYKVLSNHLQSKDTEIQRLNNLIEETSREHEYALENQLLESQSVLSTKSQEYDALKRILNQTEITRDEMIATKDSEIEAYREQFEGVSKQLAEYQVEYATLQNKLVETNGHVATYEQQISQLNGIIESQVLKIEELQQDIYEKSRNYDALVAELDNTQELQKKVTFAESASSPGNDSIKEGVQKEEDPFDAASKAELDLALYMLHQRDVRCEELTVELMQLLEERDTLQLRLSNALRENEAIRANEALVGETSATSLNVDSLKAIAGTPEADSAFLKEGQAEAGLANKLTELKVVGYKKDKTLVDEQELRRLQQMAFLQQHKDDVSRLPAEAQARLRDANYTLSRDVQSPSKVLLNWLWGTSTPKVNNA
ncbi:LOW QUALITY PROTEIN: protein lava lamp [Atheta coriaria]|uniref:LOW QUALITY PROTEIN: protein lava lamp n=1 Tax=Dalotia coriaria TaxID=877792 RepID=UPI0031F3796C